MSTQPPTPPAELSTDLVTTINECGPDQLRRMARYAEELAEYKDRKSRLEEETAETAARGRPEDLPDDVPAKATVTVKEINDNRYYYWQWREGQQIKSQYKGPVDADE